jgi:DNA-directed RNA polymerase specialized sigma24 family protein
LPRHATWQSSSFSWLLACLRAVIIDHRSQEGRCSESVRVVSEVQKARAEAEGIKNPTREELKTIFP